MPERLIICRHAHSTANEMGSEAFNQPSAGLSVARGIPGAGRLGWKLENSHDIHPPTTPVAVSGMLRSQETASYAGFTEAYEYVSLDEAPHNCELPEEWQELKQGRVLQAAAFIACTQLLEGYFDMRDLGTTGVPTEEVWISHGYRMAHFLAAAADLGLCVRRENETFIPAHCEVVELSQ